MCTYVRTMYSTTTPATRFNIVNFVDVFLLEPHDFLRHDDDDDDDDDVLVAGQDDDDDELVVGGGGEEDPP
jgi:hypothetical protein